MTGGFEARAGCGEAPAWSNGFVSLLRITEYYC